MTCGGRSDTEPSLPLLSGGSRLARLPEPPRNHVFGHSNGLATQLLDGIGAGETVIVHPDDRIEDGVRVEVM